jgi:hypothetical protein
MYEMTESQLVENLKDAAAKVTRVIEAIDAQAGFYARRKLEAIKHISDLKSVIRTCDDITLIASKIQK